MTGIQEVIHTTLSDSGPHPTPVGISYDEISVSSPTMGERELPLAMKISIHTAHSEVLQKKQYLHAIYFKLDVATATVSSKYLIFEIYW